MDARDELRTELARQQEANDADARATKRAGDDRAQYEGEVQEVKARLDEVVQLTVQALADSVEKPSSIEVEPKRGLFGKPVRVSGWKVRWRGDDAIVCPDGALLISRPGVVAQDYRRTTFIELFEKRLAEENAFTGDSGISPFDRAFKGRGNAAEAASLRGTLERMRTEMVQSLSRLLSDRGLSI
jgi:hypothetical protein